MCVCALARARVCVRACVCTLRLFGVHLVAKFMSFGAQSSLLRKKMFETAIGNLYSAQGVL